MNGLSEPISVIFYYNAEKRSVMPLRIKLRDRVYPVKKIGMHYTQIFEGILNHIWSLTSGGMFIVIRMNTKTLSWTLEELQDSENAA